METGVVQQRLHVHDLLEECANGLRPPDEISHAILAFSKSESAPDAQVFSDLLLDTLFLYDSGVSPEDAGVLSEQRIRLGTLISNLIHGKCIDESDAYERLEPPLLSAAGLIPDAKAFEKKSIRINTNLLYRQQKFNLMREENEGYSKLVVEFEAFLATTPNTAADAEAQQLLTNIQSLIGYFDLDPNRVLDVLVELAAANLISHWRFLMIMFKLSPWFVNNEKTANTAPTILGDIRDRPGNHAAAQIIGFKFQQIRQSPDDDRALAMLSSLLIKEGLIKLQDLWPHLAPSDSDLAKEKSNYQNRMLDEVDKAKGRNALAMAGGLDDEDPGNTQAETKDAAGNDLHENVRKDNKQKISLLHALLSVGALPESLFILSESSFLLNSHLELADAFNTLLDVMIEPLWNDLRPHGSYSSATSQSLTQRKMVPEDLKYRDSALILPPQSKTVHTLNPSPAPRTAELIEEFFYDDQSSQLTLCSSHEDFESLVLPYLRLAGIQIHRNISLCTKIARIGKAAIATATDPAPRRELWRAILRSSLLPSLSLIEANPSTVNDIYSLVKEFSTEERYSLYGEWFIDSYKRIPELKVQFVKTEKETKSLLRRISKTNTKEYGRRLAKVSHSNPCIVLNIALNQIESYDNLVDVVIEASRYFTLLSFDVLVYIMLTLLSNTQKRRLKEDGTSVAHWLQSLSSFTAKIFKRYSHMDPSPICIYVAKQLKTNNAFDLIILRDLINEMAGIRPNSDLSEEQLQGCSGGPYLRVEALALINERRDPSAKAPLRLLNALNKAGLTYPLPILIGQQRSHCIFEVPEEQSLLKLLANLADEVSQILLQYLEFVTLNTNMEIYTSSIRPISLMVQENSLEPVVAFMLARPALQAALHQPRPDAEERDTKAADNISNDSADVTMLDEESTDTASGPSESQITRRKVIQSVSEDVVSILPSESWACFTPGFYATFWSLSLYDLLVPKARYDKEIKITERMLSNLEEDKVETGLSTSLHPKQERERLSSTLEGLRSELASQEYNNQEALKLLAAQQAQWFNKNASAESTSSEVEWQDRTAYTIIQHCLIPRCLSSPNDATYCAKFLHQLHISSVPQLNIMCVYEKLFGPHLTTTIFSSTEREAENLGRFLADVLHELNRLSQDENLYNESKLKSLPHDDEDEEASHDEHLSWSEYNKIWYGSFHRSIWTCVKACFESKEYMHIRNVLILLDRMQSAFPFFKWIGKNVEKEVDLIINTERREDLKIRALGCKAVLKKQQGRWSEIPGKAGSTAVPPSEKDAASNPVTSVVLPADSTLAVPEKDENAMQVDTAPSTTTPKESQRNDTLLQTSEGQREAAKRKAASLSQELRARQEKTRSMAAKQTSSTTDAADKPDSVQASATPTKTDRDRTTDSNGRDDREGGTRSKPDASRQSSRHSSRAPSPPGSERSRATRSQRSGDRSDVRDSNRPEATYRDSRSLGNASFNENGTSDFQARTRGSGRDQGRGQAQQDRRLPSSARSMVPPYPAQENASTRLNNSHAQDVHPVDSYRNSSQPSNSDTRSSSNGRASQDLREAPSRPKSDTFDRTQPHQEQTYARSSRTDRNSEPYPSRNAPEGPRSLSSRIGSGQDIHQDSAVRNAPDGPRQSVSSIEGRTSRHTSVSARQQQAPAGDQFVHPSRMVVATDAPGTRNSNATSQRDLTPGSDSRRQEATTPTAMEPVVHPSRQVQKRPPPQGNDDRYAAERPRSSRANFNTESSQGYVKSGPHMTSSRPRDDRDSARDSRDRRLPRGDTASDTRSPRDTTTIDTRDSRDMRSSARDARHNPRMENADPRNSDRMDRGPDRGDARRDRASGERVSDRRDDQDTKRRYPGDSREASRPIKQRRQA